MNAWLVVGAVGAATMLFKAAGPVLLGRRPLPRPVSALVEVLAPAMLAALVVTQAVGGDRELVLDERLLGLGAGALAIAFRAPLLVVMVVAGAVAALARSRGEVARRAHAGDRAVTRPAGSGAACRSPPRPQPSHR